MNGSYSSLRAISWVSLDGHDGYVHDEGAGVGVPRVVRRDPVYGRARASIRRARASI